MDKQKLNTSELREKILKGLDLTFEKLVRSKQKDGGELAFSKDGKIIHIKAQNL